MTNNMKLAVHVVDEFVYWFKYHINANVQIINYNRCDENTFTDIDRYIIQPTNMVLKYIDSNIPICFYDIHSIPEGIHSMKNIYVMTKEQQVSMMNRCGIEAKLFDYMALDIKKIPDTTSTTNILHMPLRYMTLEYIIRASNFDVPLKYIGSKNCKGYPKQLKFIIDLLEAKCIEDIVHVPIHKTDTEFINHIKTYYYFENDMYFDIGKLFFSSAIHI